MIFDAFGRLALGQVDQNFAVNTNFLNGVSATGSIGSIRIAISKSPIGASSAGSVGIIVKKIALGFHGVSASGAVGSILTPDNDVVPGVSGTGHAGTISTALQVTTINGVQAQGSAGVVMTQSTAKILTGVNAAGSVGSFSIAISAFHIIGVLGTGSAGRMTTTVSGGGGGRKPKTGLEPIAKRPPAPPVAVKLPTYVLPNFAQKAAPALPPIARTPFERSPGIAPLDLIDMRQQIQSAQDEADIKAVLAFLDDLD